ncbi:hypothetical protein BN191_380003 [Clostridioides difficile T61]|nr:hypothetical protein BN169_500035 [Clostridioides difficile E16]CCL94516.1 hypothetical protein BN191_380003 [Clostridioides difficile T61]
MAVLAGPAPDCGGMALVLPAGGFHVSGQLFDVLLPDGGKLRL